MILFALSGILIDDTICAGMSTHHITLVCDMIVVKISLLHRDPFGEEPLVNMGQTLIYTLRLQLRINGEKHL